MISPPQKAALFGLLAEEFPSALRADIEGVLRAIIENSEIVCSDDILTMARSWLVVESSSE